VIPYLFLPLEERGNLERNQEQSQNGERENWRELIHHEAKDRKQED
jgi:hypothetical protein